MIEPVQKDEALLADIYSSIGAKNQARLWWLGQSGFLLQYEEEHLLFDPYLSDSLTRKYETTDKPHVRMTSIPVQPTQLNMVRWITSTHNHTDHLDAETLRPLLEANPGSKLLVSSANLEFALNRLQCERTRLIPLSIGETMPCGPFAVTTIPAAHESLDEDEQGRFPYVGFVVTCGNLTIYHSGDTLRYPDQIKYLQSFDIDLAILPINGRNPARRVSGNLDGEQAAQLAFDMQAACVIPCHYEMFTFNTESPITFEQACRSLGQDFHVLRCGEAWTWKESAT